MVTARLPDKYEMDILAVSRAQTAARADPRQSRQGRQPVEYAVNRMVARQLGAAVLPDAGDPAVTVPDDGLRSRQRQLAGDLRALILSGDIATGERLPSTAELRLRYGVNNMTITRAITILKAEGLVEGHRGRAVVVTGRQPAPRSGPSHQPPVLAAARTGSTRLLEVGETPAPSQVAAVFGWPPGTTVLVRHQLALHGDDAEPAELIWNYYPTELARGTALAEPVLLPGGSPAVLAALGHPVRAAVDHVSVRPATVAEFVALGLPGDVPVLRQFRVAYADGDRAGRGHCDDQGGTAVRDPLRRAVDRQNDDRDS